MTSITTSKVLKFPNFSQSVPLSPIQVAPLNLPLAPPSQATLPPRAVLTQAAEVFSGVTKNFRSMQHSEVFALSQLGLVVGAAVLAGDVTKIARHLGITLGADLLQRALPHNSMVHRVVDIAAQVLSVGSDPAGAALLAAGFMAGELAASQVPTRYANSVRTFFALGARTLGHHVLASPVQEAKITHGRRLLASSEVPNGGASPTPVKPSLGGAPPAPSAAALPPVAAMAPNKAPTQGHSALPLIIGGAAAGAAVLLCLPLALCLRRKNKTQDEESQKANDLQAPGAQAADGFVEVRLDDNA